MLTIPQGAEGARSYIMTGEDLRAIRQDVFGMSRREFMRRTGVSDTSIGRYEREEMPCPPWLGLAISAVIMGLPPYTSAMRAGAEHLVRIQGHPPEARLAILGAAFATAATMAGASKGSGPSLADALRELVATPPDALTVGDAHD